MYESHHKIKREMRLHKSGKKHNIYILLCIYLYVYVEQYTYIYILLCILHRFYRYHILEHILVNHFKQDCFQSMKAFVLSLYRCTRMTFLAWQNSSDMMFNSVRKHRDIKLVTTDKRRNQLVSEPNYHTIKWFQKTYEQSK